MLLVAAEMARDGQSTSADEPGGRASRFLGAVVAFVVAIFHPIFRVFASATANSPAHPSSHQSQEHQRSDENNHAAATVTTTTITTTTTTTTAKRSISSQRKYQDPNDSDLQADHNGEADSMHPQQQRRLAQSHGPKEVSANVRPAAAVKVTLPHINPPNGAVKKENVTANGVATLTNDNCELADATNGSKYRAVGEEQAEENRQEQLTLPPPIEPIDEQDDHEPEDPELTAERAIHHGFMSQALDMVSRPRLCWPSPPLPLHHNSLACCSISKTHIRSFVCTTFLSHKLGPNLSLQWRVCRPGNIFNNFDL